MFDQLKNLANLPSMLAKANEMKERMQKLQEQLGDKRITADAGAGMVEATVNGRLELVKIRIDRQRLGVESAGKTPMGDADVEMLEDLIVAAVHAAQTKAAQEVKEEFARMAGELGLPPGMLPGGGGFPA